jgi:hypothetical protein
MQPLPAHEACSAGEIERDHHALPGTDLGDVVAGLLDDPHRLVPEDVALPHKRAEQLVEV